MKVTNSTTKADYVSKFAPPFCKIWFVNKGKYVWTREAYADLGLYKPMHRPAERGREEWLRSNPSCRHKNEHTGNPTYLRSDFYPNSAGVINWLQGDGDHVGVALSADESSFLNGSLQSLTRPNSSTPASGFTSVEIKVLSQLDSKLKEEDYYNQILEARTDAVSRNNIAFTELLKRKKLESEASEANNKVKAFEAAYADEVQLRKEVEDTVANIQQEKEQVLKQIEDFSREWQTTKRIVPVLESRCSEANCCQNEASRELELIQMSLTTLQHETKNMRRQKEQAMQHREWWRNHLQLGVSSDGDFGFINTSAEYKHFSLFDLQIATCNFSESFLIGQGSYGCVYKGEISDRSVAIKKLNPFNMQGTPEFQQEVEVLSKLKHARLVTLIGACPEALSLVYEYLPNGSIDDHLFRKTNNPLTWEKRTHIVADMSSALLYLHSREPRKIIHGNLKPKNILLDSEFNCKIGDFMIGQLVPKKTARCPSFRGITEMESAFPYIDPELQTFQDLTPKSDIYAFGVIMLQLLTGRSPMGLASKVRRAVLCGNLTSILDSSAGEWPTFVARRLVELGLQCCEFNGRDRPELKPALVKGLEKLHLAEGQPVPSFFLCPILQELMYDPHVAADGFTYEGEAIRGWLTGGRGTSPMTNLTLSHFSLTPNHALRSAIQDWLCHC
ncbi:hypothetical protein AQUCO_02700347v1 [Aquilegia coerulea]|nr:hypothetical protein AQUCO_02700347v1 [Aquilegia coerulea]